MEKDFDTWNKIKKNTDNSDGKGEEFTRPVLIIKKHNQHSCLVVSLTTNSKPDKSKICIDSQNHPDVFANLSQIKTIDSKRLVKKMFFLDQTNFERIKMKIREFNEL